MKIISAEFEIIRRIISDPIGETGEAILASMPDSLANCLRQLVAGCQKMQLPLPTMVDFPQDTGVIEAVLPSFLRILRSMCPSKRSEKRTIIRIRGLQLDLVNNIWAAFAGAFMGFESRLAVLYLCCTVLMVYAIWMFRGRPSSFVRFLLPREVYLHRSNIVDIQLFVLNLLLGAVGLFGAVLFIPVVANFMLDQLISLQDAPFQPMAMSWGRSAAATLIIILVTDFCKYCTHYLHHENKILWPFHSVHHSAEVMTPITVSRNHPVYLLIRNIIISVGLGVAQALALFLLIGKIDLLTIGGANAGYFLFNLLGANLRHSHVWLSYGPVIEHIFISPAQHQIHHSRAKKHFNKNYGEVFAIWDWMFGTLYIPKGREALEFGLADASGRPIEQPHGTLKDAFFSPFVESFEEATGIEFKTAPQDASARRK